MVDSDLLDEIDRLGGKGVAFKADATDDVGVNDAISAAVTALGPLDIFVNSAGTAISGKFADMTLKEMDRLIDLNVRAVLITTRAAIANMNKGGRIILIGSSLGERVAFPGAVAYSATKGAVKIFTQALAREVGDRRITVNNVQPGPIDTDLNPATSDGAAEVSSRTILGRYGRVEEVASVVAFLAGPESSYITAASVTVDGGYNA